MLKHPKEAFHSNFVSLDCDQGSMVTQHGKPMFTQVCVEGRLYLEFMFDDMMRIKTWHFSIRQHRELIPAASLPCMPRTPKCWISSPKISPDVGCPIPLSTTSDSV